MCPFLLARVYCYMFCTGMELMSAGHWDSFRCTPGNVIAGRLQQWTVCPLNLFFYQSVTNTEHKVNNRMKQGIQNFK